MDQAGQASRFKLVTQGVNTHIQDIVGAFIVPAPNRIDNPCTGHHVTGLAQKATEQIIFFGRQTQGVLGAPHLTAVEIDADVSKGQELRHSLFAAAQLHTDTGEQLIEIKGFDQ